MKINFNKIIKKLINFYPFIIFSIIIIYATRKFLFKDENILYGEFFGSTNYFFFLKEFLNAWGNYTAFGHSNIGLTTSYGLSPVFWIIPPAYNIPFLLFLSFLQLIFGSFTMKIYILLALILPFIGMYFFAKYWFKKLKSSPFVLNSLSFISALVYGISALMGDRISAGHLKYNLGHGLFPLLFLFTFRAIEENNDKVRKLFFLLASGLMMGILIWLMPHLIILYLIVMAIYFIIFILRDKKKIISFFIITTSACFIGVLLNIHVWLPALFFKEQLAYITDPTYTSSYLYYISRNAKLIDLISIASSFEQTFINKAIYNNIILLKLILPVLTVIGLILNKQKKKSLFLFLVGLIGFILSIGINYPFEKIYKFLFENVFFFKSFREAGKFGILYLFSLSLLIPYIFFYVSRFLNKTILFLLLLLFTFFILYINPNFTSGNFGNTTVPFKLPEKYQRLNQFLSETQDSFRVAAYPNNQYIADYNWMPKVANGSPYANIFLVFPISKKLANSNRVITDWTSRYLDYIESNLDQPWAIQRLGEEMTRYVIIDHSQPNYITFLKLLENNPAVKKIEKIDGFTIFEIKNYNQKVLKEKPAVYYFGDIRGIKELPPNLALINIALNSPDILSKNYSDTIVLNNASLDEAFYITLKRFYFSFFPEVRFSIDPSKEFYSPGEYLRDLTLKGISFYNPEIMATNGKNNIKKISNLKRGKYKILLSSLSYENLFTNAITVTVDDNPITRTNFRKKNNTFEWVDFGEIEIKNDKPEITVENLENKSFYLDYLLIIPVDQYKKLQEDFYSKIKSKKIINLKESESLNINSLKQNQKTIYVFSQSFSPYWKICDNPVFRVNFFGTGVVCENKNNLNPQFKPEPLYKFSIILSGIFYLLIFWQIARLIKPEKKYENRN